MECIRCRLNPNRLTLSFKKLSKMEKHMKEHRQAGDFIAPDFDELIVSAKRFDKALKKFREAHFELPD
jgi:hypothetical protein